MDVNPEILRTTFGDTAKYIKNIGYPDVINEFENAGWSNPNTETMSVYLDKTDKYFQICDKLIQKRHELSGLQGKTE